MTDVAENPLAVGLTVRRVPEPCAVTIFGASGRPHPAQADAGALLASPSTASCRTASAIVGVARTEMSDEEFRARMREAVEQHGRCEFRTDVWEQLAAGMRYVSTEFADEDGELEVARALGELDETRGTPGEPRLLPGHPAVGHAGDRRADRARTGAAPAGSG